MLYDSYDEYETMYSYLPGLKQRVVREVRAANKQRQPRDSEPSEWLASQVEGEDELPISYGAGASEERMLRDALTIFYRDTVITEVVARVKGGKEANVYCCRAHPKTGMDLIAAKVYRPRIHRTLRNDAIYKEGRMMLDDDGKGIVRDQRLKRAVAKKTDFGQEIITFSWIEHENDTLQKLHAAGADVPRPIAHEGNAILMAYYGEVNQPAPTLNSVDIDPREAAPMFERLMWHVELMLAHNCVHGDLSPYNVLYWQGKAVVIDFPQAVVALKNPHARRLLQRDIDRLAQYFERYGVQTNTAALGDSLWQQFMNGDL
ncbi:MAG: RIO1 family regulatory kinase/ATPase [Caldilineales bacterium]